VVVLYRTVELTPPTFPECDLVVIASPSAARAYAALGVEAPAASIGPETTRAAVAAGVRVAAQATESDLDGLLGAVEQALIDA
jgi:uroporphyrinogen-III synthase